MNGSSTGPSARRIPLGELSKSFRTIYTKRDLRQLPGEYSMKIPDPHERLKSAWGRIDRQHNELIEARLVGNRILDVGCGYGSLVGFLSARDYRAEGIDFDSVSIEVARHLFPTAAVHLENAETFKALSDGLFRFHCAQRRLAPSCLRG